MQNTHHNCLQAKKSCMKSYLNNLSIIRVVARLQGATVLGTRAPKSLRIVTKLLN